jgi:hypothetical protein
MTRKADFNAEEWSLLLEGPPIAGLIVIAADRGGTIRESISMAKAYPEARQQQGGSELLDEIASARPELDPSKFSSGEDLREGGLRRLREAVQVLEQRASPDEADDYKRFVVAVAEKAAQAHKEGGFLGVGGKPVSEAEQAALDQIRETLGIEAPTA